MDQQHFFIGLGFFGALIIPYAYLAIRINAYIFYDQNKGDHVYPAYSDLWIMIAGAVVCFLWRSASKRLTVEWLSKHTKGGNDPKLKSFYTEKACHTFWQVQYFLLAAVWGYTVI